MSALQVDKVRFEKAHAIVLGVNNNSAQAHQSYCEKRGWTLPILSDADLQMSKAYGAERRGRLKRTVVVIDPKGTVVYYKSGMPTDDEILKALS